MRENLAEIAVGFKRLDERGNMSIAERREIATEFLLWFDRGVLVDLDEVSDDFLTIGSRGAENIALGELSG
jgi:hypothetical protein